MVEAAGNASHGKCRPHFKVFSPKPTVHTPVCQQGISFSPVPDPLFYRRGNREPERARDPSKVTRPASAETGTQVSELPPSALPAEEPYALDCGCQARGLPSAVVFRPPGLCSPETTTAAHWRTLLAGL